MFGKILGGIFGVLLAGPMGLIIGVMIGHYFDRGLKNSKLFGNNHSNTEAQQTFFKITFQVLGYIAKSDGVVTEAELDRARDIMQRLNLNETQRQKAMQAFNEGKLASFDLDTALHTLLTRCHRHRLLLQIFIDFQTRAATIDNHLDSQKEKILSHICQRLGFTTNFNQNNFFEDLFRQFNQQQYSSQQQYQQHAQKRNQGSLEDAYRLLGITSTATAIDIKKAYRKLMSQNHPDKLTAQGLPPEMLKLATEKTQKIQAAYEQICTAQGL